MREEREIGIKKIGNISHNNREVAEIEVKKK